MPEGISNGLSSVPENAGSWTIEGIGFLLGAIGVLFIFLQSGPHRFAMLVAEAAVAVGLPIGLVYAGYWISQQEFSSSERWTIAQWSIGGLLIAMFLGKWILLRQGVIGGYIAEPIFFLTSVSAIGSTSGLMAGIAHVNYVKSDLILPGETAWTDQEEGNSLENTARTDPALLLHCVSESTFAELSEIFRYPRCVAVIEYLRKSEGGTATFEELVEYTADREELSPKNSAAVQRERIAISLYHNHLPRLVNAGVISHEKGAGFVRFSPLDSGMMPQMDTSTTNWKK